MVIAAAWLTAQTITGSITGTVTDASGGALTNVRIVATNVGTNEARTTKTDDTGSYRIPVGIQFLWALILGIGLFILREYQPSACWNQC